LPLKESKLRRQSKKFKIQPSLQRDRMIADAAQRKYWTFYEAASLEGIK